MKKIWMVLLALLLAAGLVMMGCGGDDDDDDDPSGELEETVVFDMATNEGIQNLEGVITPIDESATNPIAPLVVAGGGAQTITVVQGSGSKSLLFEPTVAWGAGVDLPFTAFGFRAGDEVTVTGEIIELAGGRTQLNSTVGSENSIATANEEGAFELKVTLTAANISQIRGGSPAALRLENRADGMKVRIDNIRIVGMRSSVIVALPAPVIERTQAGVVHTISWEAIDNSSGYRILNGTEVLSEVGAAATSYAISTPGDYVVTVVALGLINVSSDSPASNALTFTVDTPSANVNVTPIQITSADNVSGFGVDGDQDINLLLDSKFLVIQFAGSPTNTDGFGGLQVVIQGPGDVYAWNQSGTPGWTNFPNDGEETLYAVFELAKLVGYPAALDPDGDDPKGKLIFNSGIMGDNFVQAYLTAFDLAAGADDVAHGEFCFLTRDPAGLEFE